ncbi:PTS sugar transporter subunit IIB [Lachnospiraceae bacterium JLR.KK008]
MKRFYLFCNAGMSTSLLASRMQKVANEHQLPIEVKAFSDTQMNDIVNEFNPEVILLGPQVKHLYDKVAERYGKDRVVSVIDSTDYGNVDGERVLKKAMKLYKESRGK